MRGLRCTEARAKESASRRPVGDATNVGDERQVRLRLLELLVHPWCVEEAEQRVHVSCADEVVDGMIEGGRLNSLVQRGPALEELAVPVGATIVGAIFEERPDLVVEPHSAGCSCTRHSDRLAHAMSSDSADPASTPQSVATTSSGTGTSSGKIARRSIGAAPRH